MSHFLPISVTGSGGFVYAGAPVVGDFTTFNFGANDTFTSLTGTQAGTRMTVATNATDVVRGADRAATTSIVAGFRWLLNAQRNQNAPMFGGIHLRNNTSGRIATLWCGGSLAPPLRSVGLFTWSDANTFNTTPPRIDPYSGAVDPNLCRSDIFQLPKWLGMTISGANIACYIGYCDAPVNLINIFTGSAAGTYVNGGGGAVNRAGFSMDPNALGSYTVSAMDEHAVFIDSGLI